MSLGLVIRASFGHMVKGTWHCGLCCQTAADTLLNVRMGKQEEHRTQKALESPCATLYKASLKCKQTGLLTTDQPRALPIAHHE